MPPHPDPAAAHPTLETLTAPRRPSALAPVDTYRVSLFVLLALACSSLLSLPVALHVVPDSMLGLIVPLAQLSPLVAALLVRRRDTGAPWYRDLALTIPSGRALAATAVALVACFAAVPLLRVVLGLALGAPAAQDVPVASLLLALPTVLVLQSLFAVGEEAGWRGWLHTQLRPFGFWPAALLTGGMWALWHAPIVLALGLHGREIIAYLGTIIAIAPLLAAARELTGTAWAAVVGHGLLNSLRVVIEQNTLGPLESGTALALDVVSWTLWIAAAWVLLRVLGPLRAGHRRVAARPTVAPAG